MGAGVITNKQEAVLALFNKDVPNEVSPIAYRTFHLYTPRRFVDAFQGCYRSLQDPSDDYASGYAYDYFTHYSSTGSNLLRKSFSEI